MYQKLPVSSLHLHCVIPSLNFASKKGYRKHVQRNTHTASAYCKAADRIFMEVIRSSSSNITECRKQICASSANTGMKYTSIQRYSIHEYTCTYCHTSRGKKKKQWSQIKSLAKFILQWEWTQIYHTLQGYRHFERLPWTFSSVQRSLSKTQHPPSFWLMELPTLLSVFMRQNEVSDTLSVTSA